MVVRSRGEKCSIIFRPWAVTFTSVSYKPHSLGGLELGKIHLPGWIRLWYSLSLEGRPLKWRMLWIWFTRVTCPLGRLLEVKPRICGLPQELLSLALVHTGPPAAPQNDHLSHPHGLWRQELPLQVSRSQLRHCICLSRQVWRRHLAPRPLFSDGSERTSVFSSAFFLLLGQGPRLAGSWCVRAEAEGLGFSGTSLLCEAGWALPSLGDCAPSSA